MNWHKTSMLSGLKILTRDTIIYERSKKITARSGAPERNVHNTMKKSKKFLCLLLALVMAGSLLLLPAAAANTQSGATRYPTV